MKAVKQQQSAASRKPSSNVEVDVDDALIEEPKDSAFETSGLDGRGVSDLAYSYWEERQRSNTPGSPLDDWLRAEAALSPRANGR